MAMLAASTRRRDSGTSDGAVTLALAAAGVVAALVSGCGVAQDATNGEASGAGTWTQPRTPWGDPDLQGVWRYDGAIPLERPRELEGRELLTDEEVKQRDQIEQEQAASRLAGLEGAAVGRRSIGESPI